MTTFPPSSSDKSVQHHYKVFSGNPVLKAAFISLISAVFLKILANGMELEGVDRVTTQGLYEVSAFLIGIGCGLLLGYKAMEWAGIFERRRPVQASVSVV